MFPEAALVLVLFLLLLPAGAGAGEVCLESIASSSVFYRLNYVQLESVYAVNGVFTDGFEIFSTTGTAFRKKDRSLIISLSTTYPNHYTHPRCTDILAFAPGKFLTATIEGTCFGSPTLSNIQYTANYVRVPCP
jgi:hypothetical protein